MIKETDCGVFIAQKNGVCLKISIPAQTCNDWTRKYEFMDLPLMDKETYIIFTRALSEFKAMFDD